MPARRTATGRIAAVLAVVAFAGSALAGCASSTAPTASRAVEPTHNQADVAFAAEMVPHHRQGLEMVDLTAPRDISAGFTDLARRIAVEQAADIDEMEAWLTAWDEETSSAPGHTMDHDALSDRAVTGSMRGLMRSRMGPWALAAEDLAALDDSTSTQFEDRWLRMMITHHQGAISMARQEITHGAFPSAIALAEQIVVTQQAEIEEMRQLLRD